MISASGTLQIASGGRAKGAQVTFAGDTGELVLDDNRFRGTIAGFTGPGTIADSDKIDLAALTYNTSASTPTYFGTTHADRL